MGLQQTFGINGAKGALFAAALIALPAGACSAQETQ